MEIAERIRHNKPDIADSSVKTYASVINNLAKKMGKDVSWLTKHTKSVLTFLKDMKPSSRKTILASLIVYMGTKGSGIEDLRKQMMDDISSYNADLKNQSRSDKDKENWIEWGDVLGLFKARWKHDSHLLTQAKLSKPDQTRLMELVLLAVYTLIPPRRSEDYCQFKLRDIDKEKDNYMDDSGFVFTTYKTAKKYGKQVVKIPKKLRQIITAVSNRDDWGDYLLKDTRGGRVTPAKLTAYMNHIFGKKVSSSLLRKSFLSTKYKNIPALKELDQVSSDMGNSLGVALTNYVKKN
jgi:hypothetical protein